jgi:hypothetical protein
MRAMNKHNGTQINADAYDYTRLKSAKILLNLRHQRSINSNKLKIKLVNLCALRVLLVKIKWFCIHNKYRIKTLSIYNHTS